jgi:hypothetical protein
MLTSSHILSIEMQHRRAVRERDSVSVGRWPKEYCPTLAVVASK